MRYSFLTALAVIAATWVISAAEVTHALMGSETIISRVDKDGDKKLSLDEVRAAAARQYDLIKSKNGDHVTMLQLGGRLVPADLKVVSGAPGVATPVSKQQYLALVDKFFDEADVRRKAGDPPGLGNLDMDELGSPAGKKLIGLLQ